MTAALASIEEQDTSLFLESDLTQQEWSERQADELAIGLAGKDRLEKALIIGEKLSHIYNSGTFRRSAPGGERWTWEDWVNKRLPELLPGEAPKIDGADDRRKLWEVRTLLSLTGGAPPQQLPCRPEAARTLQALIPRQFSGPSGWNPSVLDDPDAAEGLRVVWGLALANAAKQQRKNGPTTEDVRAAREEARPQLAAAGLIREAPAAFQQATAERMAQASARRSRIIDVEHSQPEVDPAKTQDILDSIRKEAPARERQARVDAVKDELSRKEREEHERLQAKVREYNSKLNAATSSIHDLLLFLRSVDRIDGTQYLDDMRGIEVLGMITVRDDLTRLQQIGEELMAAVNLARSSNPPTGINMTTVEV